MTKVLIIDDETQILRALETGLERNNYQIITAQTGEEGLGMATLHKPDIIILDLAMPGLTGFEVCKEIRTWSKTPIIVSSVRKSEEDKIKALDLGADDYLVKPFGLQELMARMRAVLRRSSSEEAQPEASFDLDNLHIDFRKRKVCIGGEEVHLTPKEYDLLRYMTMNVDRVLTHKQLLTEVWGPAYCNDTHTLRVHMANLRTKVETRPERPRFIHTETRIGYRFRLETREAQTQTGSAKNCLIKP
ncbi:MAG: response regulator transcription factor [Cyanobacteria bacterium SZAS TMP-1]|nr:response regulator transcription factor [Cyanobacteria bacterium SZAS TMP-1]